jgi:hypothetical protein
VVKNNIIYEQVGLAIYLNGDTFDGLDIGHNCTYNSDGTDPEDWGLARKPTDLWGVNPQFINPATNDYHLQSNSPCINAGASIRDNAVDYKGNSRPNGSKWDIGAHEFNTGEPHRARGPAAKFSHHPCGNYFLMQIRLLARIS